MMPAIIGLVEIILILGVFRYDPVAFCISKGFEAEGKSHMHKVYRKKDPNSDETIDQIIDLLTQTFIGEQNREFVLVFDKDSTCGWFPVGHNRNLVGHLDNWQRLMDTVMRAA